MAENAKKISLIGIGSNSVRLLVALRERDGYTVIERGEIVTRLGGYRITPDGRVMLSAEAIQATMAAATALASRSRELGAPLAGAVATEAVRAASNGSELQEMLQQELGTAVKILTGEEEAHLGWASAASSLARPSDAERAAQIGVIDIGGGSTELSAGYTGRDKAESVLSLDTGGRTVTSRFGLQRPVERTTLMGMMASLNIELARRASALRPTPERGIVLGGTASVLASLWHSAPDTARDSDVRVDGTWLDMQLKNLSLLDPPGRVAVGVPADRADIIVAGVAILLTILQAWNLSYCYVSERNILDGYLQLFL